MYLAYVGGVQHGLMIVIRCPAKFVITRSWYTSAYSALIEKNSHPFVLVVLMISVRLGKHTNKENIRSMVPLWTHPFFRAF